MKKLSKIFAVVLCLVMVLSMLPMGAAAATVEKSVKFTEESLGLKAFADTCDSKTSHYTAGPATVSGLAVEYTELASYGDGVQMRIKNGKAGKLWNTAALPGGITKIVFTWSATKTNGFSNADCIEITFGDAMNGADNTKKLSTVKGDTLATYTITPDADTYKYFTIELVDAHSYYWDSIEVFYNETVADDNDDNTTGGDTSVKDPDKVGEDTAVVAMTTMMVVAVAALAVLVINKKRMF